MRPRLRVWVLLPVAAILLVIGMFWAREQAAETRKDPVLKAQEGIEKSFGMKLELQTSSGNGLKVLSVRPGSPADKNGIKKDDVVVAIGDRSVWHAYQFADLMSQQLQSAGYIPLLVKRGDEYRSVFFGTHSRRPGGAPGAMPPGAGQMGGRAPAGAAGAPPASGPATPGGGIPAGF